MKVRKIEKKKIKKKRRGGYCLKLEENLNTATKSRMSTQLHHKSAIIALTTCTSLLLFILSSPSLIIQIVGATQPAGSNNGAGPTTGGTQSAASASSFLQSTAATNGNPNVILSNLKAKYKTMYACEDRQLTIDCEYGFKINLIRANYGRFSVATCNEQGQLDLSVECMSPITFRIMQDRCQDKQKCSVNATNSIFGDKCPKTRKYLEVHFQCQPDNPIPRVDLKHPESQQHSSSASINNWTPSLPAGSHGLSPILPPNNPPLGATGGSVYRQSSQAPAPQQQASDDPIMSPSLRPQPAPQAVPAPSWMPQLQQLKTVINSQIVNSTFIGGVDGTTNDLRPSASNIEPIIVTLRHNRIDDSLSNPRCVSWDLQAGNWTEKGSRILETNLTHTTCAFEQATSYLLVMDQLTPIAVQYPQPLPPQQQPFVTTKPTLADIGSPYPNILDRDPIVIEKSPQQIVGKAPTKHNAPAVASALIGWLFALFVFLLIATIGFIASNMRSTASAALKSLGNFSAFSSAPNSKFKNRRNGPIDGPGTLHNKDLLVINSQNGHQFLYAPASTTKISASASATHILAPASGAQHQGTLHHLQQQQHQQQLYSGNGTLSNLSGTGAQSNNYYYGLMGLNLFQQQQQQQQQHHLSQHHLNQQQTMSSASYHHQANKSTISTESANSTPSSSGVESGSTGMQQQQQQQGSCLIMGNDFNLMGQQQQAASNYHQGNSMNNQPTLTLNAHYSPSTGPVSNQQRLVGLMDNGNQVREHIYECVDDDKSAYAARLLMPMNIVKTNPIDPFNSNTLSQPQLSQQQQHQQRAMTLSSRFFQNNAFQQQQQSPNSNNNKRLFSHPAIVRDNQVTKTNIICSKMAQVAPQRATEISGSKFQQHEIMAVYNDNHSTTTTSTSAATNTTASSTGSPLLFHQHQNCYAGELANGAASKLGTDC